MIIDARTYSCYPGKVGDFMNVYTAVGAPIQWPILGAPVGVFTTDVGTLHQVVFWWKYVDMADREQRRRTLMSAPGWQDYLKTALPLFQTQSNCILVPTDFSPLR